MSYIDEIEKEFIANNWRTERKTQYGLLMTRPLPQEIVEQCKSDESDFSVFGKIIRALQNLF
ncbi:MAG: hypothetical protein HYW78_04780 [Parcubacteria group bacterium]|nr:hypothetical protein [Parcubacteria group bacterium]